jgi:hypothetical protein
VRLGKLLLTIAGATVLLGVLVGAASAGRLSTSSQTLRASFASLEFAGAFGTTRCAVTVEGSFHERTTTKVVDKLVGYITSVTLGACATGSATVLTETLPWHVRYSGFSGTLPNITATQATIVGVATRIRETGGVGCLARTTVEEPATMRFTREASGAITAATLGGSVRSGAECFGAVATFAGVSNSVTVANNSNRISVTLI